MCYMEMVRREICLKVNSKSKIIFMFFFSFLLKIWMKADNSRTLDLSRMYYFIAVGSVDHCFSVVDIWLSTYTTASSGAFDCIFHVCFFHPKWDVKKSVHFISFSSLSNKLDSETILWGWKYTVLQKHDGINFMCKLAFIIQDSMKLHSMLWSNLLFVIFV